ncbi:hypothetical protein [Aliidiomarina soli]|uniref:HPt domain-containing protein n=1 Tax=Aliidiomarina soli TaxID=1928574 RepID=A0A432WC37_9GAMM|nr:hypothetical protein [Aliidiomarina soli]RUO29644.1 hypothetical protein CWE14_14400 [Aliidiomarina soli]
MTSSPLLDVDYGLTVCQHKQTLYHSVLESFVQQHAALLRCETLTGEQAQELAHNWKSTAPACGARSLADLATSLAPPAPLPSAGQSQQLLELAQDTLKQIQAQLNSSNNAVKTTSLTKELLQKLEQHNLSAVTLLNSWASCDAAHWPDDDLADIELALQAFDFERAKQLVMQGLISHQDDTNKE